MMPKNTNSLLISLFMGLSILVLSGCGGSSSNYTPPPTPAPAPIPAPASLTTSSLGSIYQGDGEILTLIPDTNNAGSFVTELQQRSGFTLYVFDNDDVGKSVCEGNCLALWPPLMAEENSEAVAPFSIIQRADGQDQWALRDKPLYFFANDEVAGDVNGQFFNGKWQVATSHPVLDSKFDRNNPDAAGEYLVGSGKVLTYVPEVADDYSKFVPEYKNFERFSLYTFDLDENGVIKCGPPDLGKCLYIWPPLIAENDDIAVEPFSIVERVIDNDGNTASQWAYHGKPLYFYVNDTAAGETLGTTIPNWDLARAIPQQAATTDLGSTLAAVGKVRTLLPTDTTNETFELADVAKNDFTLYTFDNDSASTSVCEGMCLKIWPPLIAAESAEAKAPFSIITRSTGEKQWAINDLPLYFFINDTAAGQTNGEGVNNNTWHVARVAPVIINNHPDDGLLFVAHGNVIGADGNPDPTRLDFTLYTFDEDTTGVTTCFGDCLSTWPALYAPEGAVGFGEFTVIQRTDLNVTRNQWAYKGLPLYFFIGDTTAGAVTGDYTGWTIARP